MMKDKKDIAILIYKKLKNGDIKQTISLIAKELEKEKTEKLGFTKTTLLNSIGQELGKLMINENLKFKRLKELWEEGKRDERLIVISALRRLSKKDYKNTIQLLLNLVKDISDWEICDQLALKVIAILAVINAKEIFSLMQQWIKSDNKWIRRLAIATIPPYIRAEKTESEACLSLLNKIMKEEDKDVRKAIGWALREISKKNPEAVFEFLLRWNKVGGTNIKRIIKDGMKKLPENKQTALKSIMGIYDEDNNKKNI